MLFTSNDNQTEKMTKKANQELYRNLALVWGKKSITKTTFFINPEQYFIVWITSKYSEIIHSTFHTFQTSDKAKIRKVSELRLPNMLNNFQIVFTYAVLKYIQNIENFVKMNCDY